MRARNNCGLCGSRSVVPVVDLGYMPLANAFHKEGDDVTSYPLAVYFCRECTSVQLLDVVDPEVVFRQYEYLTSASEPLSDHFREMAKMVLEKYIKTPEDLVIEIGGNDGVLLEVLAPHCRVLNIDPASTAAQLAAERGVPTVELFFNAGDAKTLAQVYGQAKVIVANNVMAHIADLPDVMVGIEHLLAPDGVFIFEVHWVGNLIESGFDQIYHEHLYYHSLTALINLIDNNGLFKIFRVEKIPIHGQSLRVYASRVHMVEDSVPDLIYEEKNLKLDSEHTYLALYDKMHHKKMEIREALKPYKKVVGYGAPAKGNTLINYCNLNLAYLIDTTPGKQGLLTPGKNIPVYPPEHLKVDMPDAVLVLAWNYADTILNKEAELLAKIPFIIPFPTLTCHSISVTGVSKGWEEGHDVVRHDVVFVETSTIDDDYDPKPNAQSEGADFEGYQGGESGGGGASADFGSDSGSGGD